MAAKQISSLSDLGTFSAASDADSVRTFSAKRL
jgi:hypothetical protein